MKIPIQSNEDKIIIFECESACEECSEKPQDFLVHEDRCCLSFSRTFDCEL